MKSYLKFLSRNKFYTFIEAFGLAFSLAFVIIIGSYAWQQYSIPRENPEYENIYTFGMPEYPGLTYGFPDVLLDRVPEVEYVASYFKTESFVRMHEDNVKVLVSGVNPYFFKMFPYYELLSGTPEMLNIKSNVFISQSFADRYSLKEGDALSIDGNYNVTVSGIMADFKGSLFAYTDIIAPISIATEHYMYSYYDQFGAVVTFAKVAPGTDINGLTGKVEDLCREIYPGLFGELHFFKHLSVTRLDNLFFGLASKKPEYFNFGDRESLMIMILVGLLLLVSAIFNYINLSIALIGRRAKEMASRRLLGASKANIFSKYISESVLFTGVVFCIALLIAVLITPTMNSLLNNPPVPIRIEFTLGYILGYIGLIIIIGAVTGLTPALMASKFKPVDVIKGTYRTKSKMTFSKIFIVLQNALSVIMLAMALIMEAQYTKSLDRPLHCDISDKYYIFAFGNGFSPDLLAAELEELPCVSRIGYSRGAPGCNTGMQGSVTRDGQDISYYKYTMDSVAFDMLELEILEDFGSMQSNSVWFGESAFYATGFDSRFHDISQTLALRASNAERVAGIIADFPTNMSNMGDESHLIVCYADRKDQPYFTGLLIETVGERKEAAAQIRDTYNEVTKDLPITFLISSYLEDMIDESLRPSRNNMRLIEIFMLLSILISLLGLLAMSTYYTTENAKEVAVRKVFGSTGDMEIRRIVRRYMAMVCIAVLLALPVAIYAADKYLEQFIYKLDSYWWIFIVAIILTFVFSFLSILWQTVQVSRTNPATSLKKE